MEKKLYLSKNKKIAGVCGGIAEYFNIDPTIIRILWVILLFVWGAGVLSYIICALVIPKQPDSVPSDEKSNSSSENSSWKTEKTKAEETESHDSE